MTRLCTVTAAALLAACAAAPLPLAVTSPANATAPEGARVSRQTSLQPDDATRKTAALLSAAQNKQESSDASGPVSDKPDEAPPTNPSPGIKK